MNGQKLYQGELECGEEILPQGRLANFLDRVVPRASWVVIILSCLYFGRGFLVWKIG